MVSAGRLVLWHTSPLFEIPLFDLPHHITAMKQVRAQLGTDLGRHDEKLVMCRLAERNRPSRRHQVCAPLINQAEIPQHKARQYPNGNGQRGSGPFGATSNPFEEVGQPENEEWRHLNEKAVAIGGNAGPIWIAGNKERKTGERHRKLRIEIATLEGPTYESVGKQTCGS